MLSVDRSRVRSVYFALVAIHTRDLCYFMLGVQIYSQNHEAGFCWLNTQCDSIMYVSKRQKQFGAVSRCHDAAPFFS